MKIREYKSYEKYIEHQASKLDMPGMLKFRRDKYVRRIYRFQEKFAVLLGFFEPNTGNVLCLGARLGEEVQAWKTFGFSCIGIDLNPGSDNKLVIKGDFHNLPFDDNSFDIIYSNSLDHVFDLEKFSHEMTRVINKDNPDAVVFLEIKEFPEEYVKFEESFEVFHWNSTKELEDFFMGYGWKASYLNLSCFNNELGFIIHVPYLILRRKEKD